MKVQDEHLRPGDPGSFDGYEVKERRRNFDDYSLCPLCQGHGGWNLKLNAYGEGRHFQALCSQCWGWGWVHPVDAACVHEFKWVKNTGRCLNLYECKHCGRKREVDSSD